MCVCVGRSVASGLNEDFDATSVDRQNTDHLPPVVFSVAESDLLSSSADAISPYAESSLTDVLHPVPQDVIAATTEFYIPPPSLLTASGYLGSQGSLPEVVTSLPDGTEVMRKVGMGQQVIIVVKFEVYELNFSLNFVNLK